MSKVKVSAGLEALGENPPHLLQLLGLPARPGLLGLWPPYPSALFFESLFPLLFLKSTCHWI